MVRLRSSATHRNLPWHRVLQRSSDSASPDPAPPPRCHRTSGFHRGSPRSERRRLHHSLTGQEGQHDGCLV
jgi:hypothetical protein